MTIVVTPLTGDPDLYVWPPESGGAAWVSNSNGLAEDRVSFVASTSGEYQIEVYGYSEASYTISIEVTASLASQGIGEEGLAVITSINATRPVRTEPVVPVGNEPAGQMAVPAAQTCYDFGGDGQVGAGDIQAVASRWRLPAQYETVYDLDNDGDIDLLDVLIATTQWNQSCS